MAEVAATGIDGLIEVKLEVRRDVRGSFTEVFDLRVLDSVGIDFKPVQVNRSKNTGLVTRGIHAEPWNKFVQVMNGTAFAAIVDLRPGEDFGKVEEFELDESNALYIPAGCGNSYQTTNPESTYAYVVDQHYDMNLAGKYPAVRLDDPSLGINWPTDISATLVSDKDKQSGDLNDFADSVFKNTMT